MNVRILCKQKNGKWEGATTSEGRFTGAFVTEDLYSQISPILTFLAAGTYSEETVIEVSFVAVEEKKNDKP